MVEMDAGELMQARLYANSCLRARNDFVPYCVMAFYQLMLDLTQSINTRMVAKLHLLSSSRLIGKSELSNLLCASFLRIFSLADSR